MALSFGGVTLVRGASGSGKSTLLDALEARLSLEGWRIVRPERVRLRRTACAGLFRGLDVDASMRALARAGLAEASCFLKRPQELSDGERARLRLALAMHSVERARVAGERVALLLDEFASGLDALTALSVANLLRRFVRGCGRVAAVAACVREDIAPALRPDHVVTLRAGGSARIEVNAGGVAARTALDDVVVEEGTLADYRSLASSHYLVSAPASVRRVLRLRLGDETLGAMTISMPTLNASWRERAWPGRYDASRLDRRGAALRLNDEVRRISRVVIDPRVRGLGLATRLVRAYLDDADTVHTEAVAAMSRYSGVFARAGMRAIPLAPESRHARLLDALEHAGVEAWRLATPRAAFERARERTSESFVDREVRLWAGASRGTARHKRDGLFELFRRACREAPVRRVAFVHGFTTENTEGTEEE